MACCGKLRQQFHGTTPTHRDRERQEDAFSHREPIRYSFTYFQYLGRTGLTVVGPISGKRYRFDGYGAIVAVDPGDRRSLAAVPNLRQVRSPR
jgi:hypothetical protein